MKKQYRNSRGRYASLTQKAERMIGLILILGVAWWHLHDSNKPLENKLSELHQQTVELQVKQQELEETSVQLQNPDLSKYEFEMKKKTGVATAYSCGGNMTPAEKAMNCPNGKTASGTIPRIKHTMACDKRLMGKQVSLTFRNGKSFVGHCSDTGGAIENGHFDIYMATIADAYQFGRQEIVYVVE